MGPPRPIAQLPLPGSARVPQDGTFTTATQAVPQHTRTSQPRQDTTLETGRGGAQVRCLWGSHTHLTGLSRDTASLSPENFAQASPEWSFVLPIALSTPQSSAGIWGDSGESRDF